MSKFSPAEVTTLLLGLAVMLFAARGMGELFNRFRQPAIVGEILAGILLGPTVFGNLVPGAAAYLFPEQGAVTIGYQTVINLAVILLLLIAGLEIDLGVLWRLGRAALIISPLGIVIPFAIGFAAAYFFPGFWGGSPRADQMTFALFFGVAMSISALPVIAKMLLDLNLFKSDVGMLIMSAAMFDDLVGWIIFSVVLGLMGAGAADAAGGAEAAHHAFGPLATIGLTLGFAAFMFTAGRYLINRVLPWIQSALSWPGGVLGFVLVLTFLGAAATEAIGIHAVFGAFLVGIAVGDSQHFRAQTRTILHQFVTYIFAPIFFVSIGLNANFIAGFNLPLVLGVLAVAFLGKLVGCTLGGKLAGLTRHEGLAIAFGMNARGAMEVILGLLALQYGLIEEQMFVALVVLALLSSTISAPLMSRFVARPKEWKLDELLTADLYLPNLRATNKTDAIRELAAHAATADGLTAAEVTRAVGIREQVYTTGIGHEVAIPRARMMGLPRPVVAVGRSREGIDFGSPDGKPARLIFLLLTPREDASTAVHLSGQVARLFKEHHTREQVYESDSFQVLRALVKTESAALNGH